MDENIKKRRRDKRGGFIMQSEDDNAGVVMSTDGEKVAEIEVEYQNDSLLLSRLLKNCGIGKTRKLFFSQVDDLVALPAKGLHCAHRDSHICQESHERDPAVG